MSSIVFVVSALEAISASKDAKKVPPLVQSVKKALDEIKQHEPNLPDPEIIFAPLRLATKTGSVPLTTKALDCIGKLISYSYFSVPSSPNADKEVSKEPLIERAIDTICECFEGETTSVEIQLQIVKSLLAAVLNDKIVVHGAGLLKAVRQVYNVFLLSKNSQNQQVAQGTLTQMVGTVFERVKTRIHMKEARNNLAKIGKRPGNASSLTVDAPESLNEASVSNGEETAQGSTPLATPSDEDGPKLTLKDLEHRKSFDDSQMGDGPTMVTQVKHAPTSPQSASGQTSGDSSIEEGMDSEDAEDEAYIRDAYLVFRSFCNLSTKVLPPDQLYDLKGQAMRSKLISLHLIHTLLNNNILVFTSPLCTITNSKSNEPTGFLQAVKFYLCLSITRNGASSVDKVFEVCCEIFWLMIKFMRAPFKKEIEVFLKEIYLALLERRTAPVSQKLYFMGILNRFSADPRALVETYLNYDCDGNMDNMFQTVIEDLSKAASSAVMITPFHQQQYEDKAAKASHSEWQSRGMLPPPLSTAHMSIHHHENVDQEIPKEYIIKRQALDCLVETLRSLVNWSQQGIAEVTQTGASEVEGRPSEDFRESMDPSMVDSSSRMVDTAPSTPPAEDDFELLEKEKQRKTALSNAIKLFNFKPKRGMKALIEQGFIPSDSDADIAHFLLTEPRLDKAVIGEYLGEGDEKNIAIMHAFVDHMDFSKRRFVDAIREFLQSFRLPGESQKIDRFMLKFANRYVTGNPKAYANADTAYILSYSVVMLNTDLHGGKTAKPMTKEQFIKNNSGINDGQSLPDDYITQIYDDIANEEIVLKSEREAAAAMGLLPQPTTTGLAAGLGQAFATVGRDLKREAYLQQSEEISLRSEQLFKNLFKNQRKNPAKNGAKFMTATSFKHVGPMFDVTWMSFFSGLSGQMQNAQNIEIIKICMEGMKLAVRIACLFDLETPREAFISALKNATNLNNPTEMMAKNVEALKVILEIAQTEGNLLKGSWRDILMCVSQLDRLQLISEGVDEGSIPDVSKARIVAPSRQDTSASRKSSQSLRPPRPRPRSTTTSSSYSTEIGMESRSDEVIKSVDRIFTNTANLSGDAIVYFVRALTEVSWEEIRISGSNDSPRTYSLQKLVEISYYNMTRVRFEWTNIWVVLGEHFNNIGSLNNTAVVFFALDSLRQLSMRFMEIEELPGFKFQKDFLKPFEHVMINSSVVAVKDMALRCLIQMIQARGENIRSGWRTMFGVFTVAAREPYESIVNLAFDNVNQVYKTRFGVVISQGAFADLIVCLTEFSKNMKFQKKGLQAMETLKSIIPRMLKTPECPLSHKSDANSDGSNKSGEMVGKQPSRTSQEEAFWFPVLFSFHDVLMTGEDLEVRSNALNYLFDSLIRYGRDFPTDFWDILWRQILYPIFMVLKSKSEMSNAEKQEELSVWLSTTMIQALRNMITLFTHYFDSLEYMLDRFLDLLALCICQENDTIARIGSNCLQQLILQNVTKFQPQHWAKIVGAFVELFERTTAYALFTATTLSSNGTSPPLDTPDNQSLKIDGMNGSATSDSESILDDESKTPGAAPGDLEDYKPQSELQQQPVVVTAARRRYFNQIITKCVLQLLMIETVNELFSNDAVYAQIPSPELLRLMSLLKKSFLFAKKFNENKELRMNLWREGFMKQPPNLLKQESGSAATYVSILLRMYHDESEERKNNREDTEQALVPLCTDIIRTFTQLEEESQQRNIAAWRPVVVDVIEGYTNFPQEGFEKYMNVFYELGVELLGREIGADVRLALQSLLRRVGEVKLGIVSMARRPSIPGSPMSNHFAMGGRRASRRE